MCYVPQVTVSFSLYARSVTVPSIKQTLMLVDLPCNVTKALILLLICCFKSVLLENDLRISLYDLDMYAFCVYKSIPFLFRQPFIPLEPTWLK